MGPPSNTGGQADDIWIYDFATKSVTNVTQNPAQDIIPMWSGTKIYFASDRDGVLNVFSTDSTGRGRRETSAWTGAFDPAPVPERGGLLVGGFHDLNWGVYY